MMSRRPVLALLIVVIAGVSMMKARDAHGCLEAHHTRRILLGSSQGRLVVLQLDWAREDRAQRSVRWRGPVVIGLLAGQQRELSDTRALGTVDIEHRDLLATVQGKLRAAEAAARSYPGFRPAGLPRHVACDFETSCDRVRIGFDASQGAFLAIRGAAPQRIPLPLPDRYIDDVGRTLTKAEHAASLLVVSLLSYEVDGREILVVDLGTGDEDHSPGEPAFWPPCGCAELSRCPPLVVTMHHGAQFEVVVPLSTPRPPASAPPPAPRVIPRPAAGELSRAETRPKLAPRTDGIYATQPVCRRGEGWSRRFLRFFPDGTARLLEGDASTTNAFRVASGDRWVVPEGKYRVRGRRVRADFAGSGPPPPVRSYDGILETDGYRAVGAGPGAAAELFRFHPIAPPEPAAEP